MSDNEKPALADDLFAAELFSDGALSFVLFNGVVRIVLASVRSPQNPTGPGPLQRAVCGRLAMSIPAAQALALDLHDFLQKQGFDPTQAAKGDATPQ